MWTGMVQKPKLISGSQFKYNLNLVGLVFVPLVVVLIPIWWFHDLLYMLIIILIRSSLIAYNMSFNILEWPGLNPNLWVDMHVLTTRLLTIIQDIPTSKESGLTKDLKIILSDVKLNIYISIITEFILNNNLKLINLLMSANIP